MADSQDNNVLGETGTKGTLIEDLQQSAEDDARLLATLNQKFKDMQKYKQDAEVRSRLNMMYYKGKHWRGWDEDKKALVTLSYPSAAKPVTVNLIRLGVRAHTSNIGKLTPQFRVIPMREDMINDTSILPKNPQTGMPILADPMTNEPISTIADGVDMQQADNASRVLNLHLERYLGSQVFEYIIKNGIILGLGVTKSYWDINREKGMGDVVTEPLSWFSFYYDSTCKDLIGFSDARVMCHYVQKDVNYIKEVFNYDITPDNKEYPEGGNIMDKKTPNSRADTVLLYEMWVKEMVPWSIGTGEIDPETGEEGQIKFNKFVYNVYTFVSTKLLDKKVNPLGEDDDGNGVHPFSAWPVEQCPDEVYPYGMVNDVRGVNQEINLRMTQISASASLTANPPIFVVKDSGIEETDITDIIGHVHEVAEKGLAPFSVQFNGVGADAYNSLNLHLKQFQDLFNMQDAALGRFTNGITSGSQLQILLDAGNAAVGILIENYKEYLKRLSKLVLLIMKNKLAAPRQYAFDTSKKVDIFTFDPSNLKVADVKVSIENNIGGKASFREEVMKMLQIGAIPKPIAWKLLGYNDIDDMERALQEERVFDAQMGVMAQEAQAAQQASMQSQESATQQGGMTQTQNQVAGVQQVMQ